MTTDLYTGWESATNAILGAMHEHFDDTLKELWEVDASDRDCDGVYLPGARGDVRLEVNPDTRTLAALRRPVLFVGPAGDTEVSDNYFIDGEAYAFIASMPFVVAIFYPSGVGDRLKDPVTGRDCTDREIMMRRGLRYQGALADTVHKHAGASCSISEVLPVDSRVNAGVQLEGLTTGLGSAVYYFTVQQHQTAPKPVTC